ncbi:hypothetical protein ACJMK2_020209 [Sinanodonta woodiana]|uniref:Endonuclease/exonuclease/phosphatase domain-containing protein n=1 Tax=Sinanodonta woodiana TaxID=1069815 RepID=A0ABD3TYF9_SINWO
MMTDNWERLINFCQENYLVIGGTLFEHKDIHKLTWTSPDGRTQSQIDHIIINGRWKHSLQDVRVMRNADIGSDHFLLVAKVTLKLRKVRIGVSRSKRFDVDKLKNSKVKEEFSVALWNRFSALEDETALTIDNFNKAMKEAEEEVLGYINNRKTEWIPEETWTRIEERRQIKKRLLDSNSPRLKDKISKEYRGKDKEVNKSARRDRREYTERLAKEAEVAAGKKDMKTVY